MKRFLCMFLCATLLFSALYGCADAPELLPGTLPAPETEENNSPFPLLENDTSKSPLGLYGDTVYGIVESTNEEGLTLKMQGKTFFFKWTDKVKRHYTILEADIGKEVGLQYEIEDDTFVATGIEVVTSN